MNLSELSDYSGRTAFANYFGHENCILLSNWETADLLFHDKIIGVNRLVEAKLLSQDNLERYPETLMVEKSKADRLLRRTEKFGLASPLFFFCVVFERGQFIAWLFDCEKLAGMDTVQTIAQSKMGSNRSEVKEAYIINKSDCRKIVNQKHLK